MQRRSDVHASHVVLWVVMNARRGSLAEVQCIGGTPVRNVAGLARGATFGRQTDTSA